MDRLALQELLESVPGVSEDGKGNKSVYFQPPENIRMTYPAIVYKRSKIYKKNADDDVHVQTYSYQVTVIDSDPDSSLVQYIAAMPRTRFENHFVVNGLNHDIFEIYT